MVLRTDATLSMPTATKTVLVVGIDFGTTFSGVSWLVCRPGSPRGQPEVVSQWPTSNYNRQNNPDSLKVPSKVYYDTNGTFSWGYKIPAGVETIEWFKLLLLNDGDLQNHLKGSSHLHDAKRLLSKLRKSPVQVTSDYLKALWNHALKQICDEKGSNFVDGMPFEVVLTVPAIWTDYARGRMYEAAKLAGILKDRTAGETNLSFISEPEAAAIATMPELGNRGDLHIGDSFVVLDAGGGTVDIISYKINKLEPLSVSECVEGEAELCGATFLDKEFESLLKRFVGEKSWKKMNQVDIKRMMNNEWQHGIKTAFDRESDDYTVELPNHTHSAPLQFSSDELRPIFDKIIAQINELATKQITAIKAKTRKQPKLLILVGGFGRSPYMFTYLKGALKSGITVLQARGDKPWTAICRGATISRADELNPTAVKQLQVQSRIARSNYGWVYRALFDSGIHDPRDKCWDDIQGMWLADNQMQWVIKRGDDISLQKTKTYDYFQPWAADERGQPNIEKTVHCCDDANPPSRMEEHIRPVATFTYQVPKPVETLEKVFKDKLNFYRMWRYEWKVSVSGASFDVTLISDGKEEKMEKVFIDLK
ncbi:hypothetical protein F5Y03DRAFT_405699 [Xylaria venustula]|nr:hypothetical protein F5Y03DRAFT_405699 [Xylaria venustula]